MSRRLRRNCARHSSRRGCVRVGNVATLTARTVIYARSGYCGAFRAGDSLFELREQCVDLRDPLVILVRRVGSAGLGEQALGILQIALQVEERARLLELRPRDRL